MRFTMILSEPDGDALRRLAALEDRPPRDQAVRLVRQGLMRAGVLTYDGLWRRRAAADGGGRWDCLTGSGR